MLQKYDGTTETVDTTDATTYSEPGSSIAPPGVYDGENVAVTLDPTASSPTATNVVVFPEKLGGRVTNVAGSTVTLTNKRGTDTVIVSPSTKYYEKGASPTAVSNGEVVTVFGLPDAGTPGELDAQVVAIFSPATPPQPQQPAQPRSSRPCLSRPSRPRRRSRRGHASGLPRSSRPSPRRRPTAPPAGIGRPRAGRRSPTRRGEPRHCRDTGTPGRAQPRRLRWARLRPPVTAPLAKAPGLSLAGRARGLVAPARSAGHARDQRAIALHDGQLFVLWRCLQPGVGPEDHGGAVGRLPTAPGADPVVAGVTRGGEGEPRPLHLARQLLDSRAAPGEDLHGRHR